MSTSTHDAGYTAGTPQALDSMPCHAWCIHRPAPAPPRTPLQLVSAATGERLRLGQQIADDAARAEIELYCPTETLGTRVWYDTARTRPEGPEFVAGVQRARRYLTLRGHVQAHPVQLRLVRFAR